MFPFKINKSPLFDPDGLVTFKEIQEVLFQCPFW